MSKRISRRKLLKTVGAVTGVSALASLNGCEKSPTTPSSESEPGPRRVSANEEYVWISANANLPLFVAHDHPALLQIGKELGVKVTIAGPNTVASARLKP
jgi:hypothetical protein